MNVSYVQGVPEIAALIRDRDGLGVPPSLIPSLPPFSTSMSRVAWYRIPFGSPKGRAEVEAMGAWSEGASEGSVSASGGNMRELRFY